MKPLISAVITTYKRPVNVLKRSIDSVLNQTYQNIELIVVNDFPENRELSDQIMSLIDSYEDDRIKYIAHEKNMGACKARNTGIANSLGDYIAFLDDDDEWFSEKLQSQLDAFKSDRVGAVTCNSYYYAAGVQKDQTPTLVRQGKGYDSLIEALLCGNCVGGTSQPLIRKQVLEELGGFDESLPASQDYDMWMRIAQKYDIVFLQKTLVNRYYSEDAITVNYEKKMTGFKIFQEKNKDLYKTHPDALNYRYAQKVHFCFSHKKVGEGLWFWWLAIKTKCISMYNVVEPAKGIVKLVKQFNEK